MKAKSWAISCWGHVCWDDGQTQNSTTVGVCSMLWCARHQEHTGEVWGVTPWRSTACKGTLNKNPLSAEAMNRGFICSSGSGLSVEIEREENCSGKGTYFKDSTNKNHPDYALWITAYTDQAFSDFRRRISEPKSSSFDHSHSSLKVKLFRNLKNGYIFSY